MSVNSNIFKAYDIRGIYPDEINEEAAYKIGQAFVSYLESKSRIGGRRLIVGYDTRLSSESLAEAVIQGLIDSSIDAISIGLSSTPNFYFAVGSSNTDGGIMITASHLSKDYNGLKIVFGGNTPLNQEEIIELKNLVLSRKFEIRPAGNLIKKDFAPKYVNSIKNFHKIPFKPLKVVMDASNGMAGLYAEKIFAGTRINLIPIFFELDGNFPNHEADPKIPENRAKLVERIKKEGADLGFMFDGDADRAYAFDRNGEVIDPSLVSALVAEFLIKNSSKNKIVVEVRTSNVVRDWVEKIGGKVEVSSCWTIPIKLKMKSDPQIIFGSETSGHYIFADFYKIDDGILCAFNFLQAISAKEKSIIEIIKEFKEKYFIIEETNFEIADKEKIAEILEKLEKKYFSEGGKIVKIDGLTVEFTDWWFNLRKSNTEPLARLNIEANSEKLLFQKRIELSDFLKSMSK